MANKRVQTSGERADLAGEHVGSAREAFTDTAKNEHEWRSKMRQRIGKDPVTGKDSVPSISELRDQARSDYLKHNRDG